MSNRERRPSFRLVEKLVEASSLTNVLVAERVRKRSKRCVE